MDRPSPACSPPPVPSRPADPALRQSAAGPAPDYPWFRRAGGDARGRAGAPRRPVAPSRRSRRRACRAGTGDADRSTPVPSGRPGRAGPVRGHGIRPRPRDCPSGPAPTALTDPPTAPRRKRHEDSRVRTHRLPPPYRRDRGPRPACPRRAAPADPVRRRGRCRAGRAAARGARPGRLPRPDRHRRSGRVRRVLPGRRVGRPRPGGRPHGARPARRRPGPGPAATTATAATTARTAGATPPARRAPHARRPPHRQQPPLRPVRRPVHPLPRRHPHLLLRRLPRLPGEPGPARRGPAPQDRPAARPGRRGRGNPAAGGRHRPGRAGPAGRRPRRPRHLAHPLPGAAGPGPGESACGGARRAGPCRAVRLPRGARGVRRRRRGGDDRGGGRGVPAGVLPRPGRTAGSGRPGGAAGHHRAARADGRLPRHLHLDPPARPPRRSHPLHAGDRGDRTRPQPAAPGPPRRVRRPLRRDAAPVARAVHRARRRGRRARLRRGLPQAVDLPSGVLRGRVPGRLPRRAAVPLRRRRTVPGR